MRENSPSRGGANCAAAGLFCALAEINRRGQPMVLLIAFPRVLGYNGDMIEISFAPYAHKRVAVALSGGCDSVALFTLFCEQAEKLDIALSAVHVEHGIRGESSRADAAFVRDLCARAGVPLRLYEADVPAIAAREKTGVEEAARAYRYGVFRRLIEDGIVDLVATAHHAGDNAESVLFNLFRGASLTGAGGIRAFVPVQGERGIVRPLLSCPKGELAAYLSARGIPWREDESNADTSYVRNFLRRRVLAPAKEAFPFCEKNVYAFSRAAREDDDFLYSLTDGYVEEGEEFFIRADAPAPVFRRCCVRAMRYFGVEKDYTAEHVFALCALARGESGAEADLLGGLRAFNDYGRVAVCRPLPPPEYEYPFSEGEFVCGKCLLTVRRGVHAESMGKALHLDGAKLPDGAVIRPRREGDVFKKFGGGTKKLKEFFIDRKIPARHRSSYPLIAAGKEVFAVCGEEISDKVRGEKTVSGFSDPERMFTLTVCKRGEDAQCTKT